MLYNNCPFSFILGDVEYGDGEIEGKFTLRN